MNKEKLKVILEEKQIRPDYFCLDKPYPNHQCLCLVYECRKWKVYFAERGVKDYFGEFDSESEACDFFLKIALSSQTNRLL